MTFDITLSPSQHRFPAEADETILDAGIRHGHTLPYGCRNGVCGVCKGKVLQGSVDHGNYQPHALSDAEKAQGLTLFCCARPQSDLVVECHELSTSRDIPVKTLPCRVEKLERLTDDVMALYLRIPASERLQFLAGQYLDILLKDGTHRSFSLANAPHDDEFLQLHIRHIPGGNFTGHVFNEMKVRDILRIKGPLGSFYLREDSSKPVILLASGTGFAPAKAIIEHALYSCPGRPLHLYWGVRKASDFYMLDRIRRWENDILFTPVVSDEAWSGRTGFVHQAVLEDYADLSVHQVYASGAPVVVEAALRDFTTLRGLPREEFFSDAFAFTPKS